MKQDEFEKLKKGDWLLGSSHSEPLQIKDVVRPGLCRLSNDTCAHNSGNWLKVEWCVIPDKPENTSAPPTPSIALDFTKPVQTKCGFPVTIWSTNLHNPDYPIVGHYADADGIDISATWTADGKSWITGDSVIDLVNIPQRIKRELWVNVYPEGVNEGRQSHASKEDADKNSAPSRIACVKVGISCNFGEGL